MTTRRKALFGAVVCLLVLGAAEGISRLLWKPPPPRQGTYPSMQIYVDTVRHKASEPRPSLDGPLPGPTDDRVLMRVPLRTPGSVDFTGGGGAYKLVDLPGLPGSRRRVLVFGGSAAWGPSFDYPKTFAALVQQGLRRELSDPSLTVVNLARPGWELNRVTELLLHVVKGLQRPPAAVILLSGNNELLHVEQLRAVGVPMRPPLALYRLLTDAFSRRGWLRPPADTNPNAFVTVQSEPYTGEQMCKRVWRPGRGVGDASFWLAVRQAHLDRYRQNLRRVADQLRRRGAALVLVPPPINFHYLPGGMQIQPATFKKIGPQAYGLLATRLERTLKENTTASLEALVKEHPDGALQRFALGQRYDAAGRRQEAYEQIMAARGSMMGFLESLPAMNAIARSLAGPGVLVMDTRAWYRDARPVRKTALAMFADSCHLTDVGHARLARMIVPALSRQLKVSEGP